MCYVSAVLSGFMFCLLELKTMNTGQACMIAWLNDYGSQDGGGGTLEDLFCSYNSLRRCLPWIC
jgi:hypothetical protein